MRPALTAVAILALGACAGQRAPEREVPGGACALHVYVDALPAEAAGLRLEIAGVRVVGDEGSLRPLDLALPVLDGTQERRQRLLATGFVPEGTYRGLQVDVAAASFRGGALQVSPDDVAYPLSVQAGGAALVVLRVQQWDSLPTLHAAGPGVLAPGLTSVALGEEAPVLSVLHKLTGEIFGLHRTASRPTAAALDASGERAYVVSAGEDVIETFDLVRGVKEPSFPLLAGDAPVALAASRDGRTLVSVNAGSGTVTVLDAPVVAQRFRLSVGVEPRAVVLSPDDRRAFVLNTGSDSVSVIDVAAGTVLSTLAVDASPRFAALDPTGRRLVVVHRDSPYLAIVRLSDLSVERRAQVGPGAVALAVDPRSNRLFLARRGTGGVEVFDPQSLLPIDTIRLGGDASFLTIDPEGERLWAALPRARQVRTFRLVGGDPLSTTDLGTNPAWIAVAGGK